MSFEKFFLIAMSWLLFWILVCLAFGRLFEWLEPDDENPETHRTQAKRYRPMTPPKITIAVSGPRGAGNTVTAMRIVVLLRSLGFDTRYQGATEQVTRVIEELLRDDPTVFDDATEPREFLVLDTGNELLADEGD